MKKIGITGCMGSGKSTVSKVFAHLGVPVYDADARAKHLMHHIPSIVTAIRELFGIEAYDADGILNRSHVSRAAFSNPELLAGLNAVVHPAVFSDFDAWCEENSAAPYVIKEAALMFETDSWKQLQEVIVVSSPEDLRIQRAMLRDHSTREQVLARMKNQMSEEEKLARANYEIRNNEKESLIRQVLWLHNFFRGHA
jgi:dephospho-CoA kinase